MNLLVYTGILLMLLWWIEPYSKPLIMRAGPGEELERWLAQMGQGNREERGLPSYKFYSGLITTLLEVMRRFGGTTKEALLFLREGLQYDLQFEKKISELRNGTFFQMFIMASITWGFIYFALMITQTQISQTKLLGIFSWQLMGFLLLPFLINSLRKRYFSDIGQVWKTLYVLKSLERMPLSRSEVLRLSDLQELEGLKNKKLLPIIQKIKRLGQDCLKLGKSYDSDLKNLMEELRFMENWHFSLFEKRLTGIKLLLLGFFFLPSYLVFIILLIGSLNL